MAQQVEGSKAPGQTDDSSPPVKVGGVYNTTLPTYSAGTRAEAQFDSRGAQRVYVAAQDSTNVPATAAANADSVLASTVVSFAGDFNYLYNGTAWDRQYGTFDQVLMASSSLSASTAISVLNYNGRGIMAFMNITSAFPGSGSTTYTLKLKAIQPNATTSAVTICAMPPASASGAYVLCVYPGAVKTTTSASGAANLAVFGVPVPRNFQIVASLSSGATSKEVVMSLGLTVIN